MKNKSTKKVFSAAKLRKIALQYLEENRLMSIAVCKGKRPWAATVFFAHDKSFNVLFFSRPDTVHARFAKENNLIAGTVNHKQGKTGSVKGIQFEGMCQLVSEKDLGKFYRIFNRRFSWAKKFENDHKLFIIRLKNLYMIDDEQFGHFYRVSIPI
ncbi:MAG: hypothetical protein A3G52_00090 [Candidatus Taylorbacteria bacterium RIFCSPLOWO2_12_FULL_43_20]|uniref:Pyridoxamine 5'-phosphate oxidase putative domain-containing protein n=1 Tax=Candidatus Taylorbacteria bacterium RIFCSPLOWO2_12_FULL_43_20 TaxID=1802332 RepID=A0A1G2P4P3_9BACT|nr:MAG: hypothetical protein A2825_03145 [Candidatus Taylorbacteria bacterium RIFCSPHIGHO2_01_FULL_43_120]OHA22960.1 MAG: hypothetical protein A3B98_02880 [Candidatus Taylorbacteria bacterium RIFCSPHIGHO2_02_FULL_43_55]OHA30198.1 MAG: hypothetical protein A3E92_01245 [Candidatus Taylorbacteria bacterium RIFCSPHIGHO2_12_FULL_42_34]OHA31946.1 MAG: hypothetical protein A3B09_01000 [Candidatus Taylorbacteria bacterium RIFCSPLOWO2_01_FULL_43_83]OHA37969.1 MAG: hypothetical protein A3H58_01415 [Candi